MLWIDRFNQMENTQTRTDSILTRISRQYNHEEAVLNRFEIRDLLLWMCSTMIIKSPCDQEGILNKYRLESITNKRIFLSERYLSKWILNNAIMRILVSVQLHHFEIMYKYFLSFFFEKLHIKFRAKFFI